MANKDIVVVGASTGGVEALQILVRDLPQDFHASIFIVLHVAPYGPNVLDKILDRAGSLPASNAQDWEEIRPGRIYVAPADHHLLLDKCGYVRLSRGPKENRFRPAIDPLFRSAADAFGPRVVGVILTGALDDGTAGLWAVKEQRGTAIVQDPEQAVAPSMPLSALKFVEVNYRLPLEKIAPTLVALSQTQISIEAKPASKEMEAEVKIAREDNAISSGILEWGEPSVFACPECHGVLMQLTEGSNLRFRCHTGHAYSVEALLTELSETTEQALWNSIRAFEEKVLLMRRMAGQLHKHGHEEAARQLMQKAEESHERSEQLRKMVMTEELQEPSPGETPEL